MIAPMRIMIASLVLVQCLSFRINTQPVHCRARQSLRMQLPASVASDLPTGLKHVSPDWIPLLHRSASKQRQFEKDLKQSINLRGKLGVDPLDPWIAVEAAYLAKYQQLDQDDEISKLKLEGLYEDLVDHEWQMVTSRFRGEPITDTEPAISDISQIEPEVAMVERLLNAFTRAEKQKKKEDARNRFLQRFRIPRYYKKLIKLPGPRYVTKMAVIYTVLFYLAILLPMYATGWSFLSGFLTATNIISPRSEIITGRSMSEAQGMRVKPRVTKRAYLTTLALALTCGFGGWFLGGWLQSFTLRLARMPGPVVQSCTSTIVNAVVALFVNTHEYNVELFADGELPEEEVEDDWGSKPVERKKEWDPFEEIIPPKKDTDDDEPKDTGRDKGKDKRRDWEDDDEDE